MMIRKNPKKKNTVPQILDGFKKNKTVFLAPIKDTIPIRNES